MMVSPTDIFSSTRLTNGLSRGATKSELNDWTVFSNSDNTNFKASFVIKFYKNFEDNIIEKLIIILYILRKYYVKQEYL